MKLEFREWQWITWPLSDCWLLKDSTGWGHLGQRWTCASHLSNCYFHLIASLPRCLQMRFAAMSAYLEGERTQELPPSVNMYQITRCHALKMEAVGSSETKFCFADYKHENRIFQSPQVHSDARIDIIYDLDHKGRGRGRSLAPHPLLVQVHSCSVSSHSTHTLIFIRQFLILLSGFHILHSFLIPSNL
jgi:hypothetical protein